MADRGPLEISRPNATTLTIRPLDAYMPTYVFRDPDKPLAAGYRVPLHDVQITVTAADSRGQPLVIDYDFMQSLDDRQLCWVIWSGRGFKHFTPPAIGAVRITERIPFYWWAP